MGWALIYMAQRVRPTWSELMEMERGMAEAVLGGVPRLDNAMSLAGVLGGK